MSEAGASTAEITLSPDDLTPPVDETTELLRSYGAGGRAPGKRPVIAADRVSATTAAFGAAYLRRRRARGPGDQEAARPGAMRTNQADTVILRARASNVHGEAHANWRGRDL